jgi:hypothetical protein
MTTHEPATLATDYLLAVLAAVCALRLRREMEGKSGEGDASPAGRPNSFKARQWWRATLWFIAASGLIGGTSHGFFPDETSGVTAAVIWWAALVTLSLASAAMAMALLYEWNPASLNFWIKIIGAKFFLFEAIEMIRPKFVVAMADYGSTLLIWLVVAMVWPRPWRGWIIGVVVGSAIGAAVQQSGWDLASWFNHNDLYHVIQAGVVILMYQAGRRF